MTNEKKQRTVVSIFIYFGLLMLYILAAYYGGNLLSNITSPLLIFYGSCTILLLMHRIPTARMNWIILAAMAFSWGIADIIWLIQENMMKIDPNESTLLLILYTLPNIFLAWVMVYYFIHNIRKWHRFRLLLDLTVTFFIVIILVIQIIIARVELSVLGLDEIITFSIYVTTNIIVIIVVLTMMASSRFKQFSGSHHFITGGAFLYVVADLWYIYDYYIGTYVANTLIDILYMLAFVLFALSAHYEVKRPTIFYHYDEKRALENYGKTYVIWWLSIPPIVFFSLGLLNFITMLGIFAGLIAYQLLRRNVHRTLITERALSQEQDIKNHLELLVKERTDSLLKANEALKHQSETDELTGLYNRRYFTQLIDDSILLKKGPFSIFYMDLDRFKVINDLHGHAIGDAVLKVIAERFKKKQCPKCTVARIGGDEFSVLYASDDMDDIKTLSHEIINLFSEQIKVNKFQFYIGVSIGIARYPKDASTTELLMKYSDIAMYHTKEKDNPEKFTLYSNHLIDRIERRNYIELLLRGANFKQDFELYYQPQFKIETRELIGAEALIRWKHETEGFIPPSEFIPIAEETGMILEISDWVTQTAMLKIKEWNLSFKRQMTMGINMSPVILESLGIFTQLQEWILKYEIQPEWLDFEITENSAMNIAPKMENILAEFSKMGVRISIDDFGTGYSSLSYIRRFEIDTLKIAKELIDNIHTDSESQMIVKAIVMMAEGMGLTTIAEGVETNEQLEILKKIHCSAIQGYIYGRPVPADTFVELHFKKSALGLE